MWKQFWASLKELLSPGGYERRYNRYHNRYYEQLTGSPPPPKAAPQPKLARRPTAKPKRSGLDKFNTNLRKTNRGLRSLNRTIKWLTKPQHAKGKHGLKY